MRRLTIRKTEDEDLDTCLDIDRVCFTHPNDTLHVDEALGWSLWLATYDNYPVGYCASQYLPGRGAVYLCRAAVLPEARGRGLQRRMVSVRLMDARKRGYHTAISYVHVDNLPSANTLIKCGFTLYEPTPDWKDRRFLFFRRSL